MKDLRVILMSKNVQPDSQEMIMKLMNLSRAGPDAAYSWFRQVIQWSTKPARILHRLLGTVRSLLFVVITALLSQTILDHIDSFYISIIIEVCNLLFASLNRWAVLRCRLAAPLLFRTTARVRITRTNSSSAMSRSPQPCGRKTLPAVFMCIADTLGEED